MSEKVTPYDKEREKKEQIEEMFDNISKRYDALNRILSLGIDVSWRKKVVNSLKKATPKKILDVATGTGDLAIMIAQRIPDSQVTGLDLSEGMLSYGRKKVTQKNLNNRIEMIKGDSENLPFEDNAFDAITVAFGVRNFQDLEKGLQEMSRVLKPNGELYILEFSKPTSSLFKGIYYLYFKNILPLIGRMISKDDNAYTYLPESVEAFPSGKEMENIILNSGYKQVNTTPLTFGISSIYTCTK